MIGTQVFVGLGSNAPDARARLEDALRGLDVGPLRLAAVARPRWTPFEGAQAPDVLNTVAELRASGSAGAALRQMQQLEAFANRDRSNPTIRTLDLDLLMFGDQQLRSATLTVPHPRALDRGFVLAPWAEIAPLCVVPGTGEPVVRHRARLQARAPEMFASHRAESALAFAERGLGKSIEVLSTRAQLRAWRMARTGTVGVVPTMGALHAGHASLAQRAVAECDDVIATIFVNPLQFAPGEDLDRYPRTFDEDATQLARCGVGAIYAPAPADLYPADFSTHVVPRAMADVFEGATRPTHFEGVTTIVTKLLIRTQPDRAYFAYKDAQQLAIIRRLVRDLDLPGLVCPCPTVHDAQGLALSSRNRYLSAPQRVQARALSGALRAMRDRAAAGVTRTGDLVAAGHAVIRAAGLQADYLAIVDPETFEVPDAMDGSPLLAIGALPVGPVRLLDNRWIACPA